MAEATGDFCCLHCSWDKSVLKAFLLCFLKIEILGLKEFDCRAVLEGTSQDRAQPFTDCSTSVMEKARLMQLSLQGRGL